MSVEAEVRDGPIEVFWMPGCSSCLRMKEFIERTGVPYEEVNIAANPTAAHVFASSVLAFLPWSGGHWRSRMDLVAIAKLVGTSTTRR